MKTDPNWASPPGETIRRLLAAREVSSEELADRIGLRSEQFETLISGQSRITLAIAEALAETLGSSPRFWLARDKSYVRELARLGATKPADEESWAATMPTKSMKRYGWLPQTARGQTLRSHLLAFFDCASIQEWGVRYSSGVGEVAFRTSLAFPADGMATLVWLRAGEKQAELLGLRKYNAQGFKKLLPALRRLSVFKHPKSYLARLQSACSEVGVAVTSSRSPDGCRASGASWFNRNGNPVIHLSFRHLSEDHAWFTFFHEAGHVVLHGQSHIDGEGASIIAADQADQEAEANAFAQDILLPREVRERLIADRPSRSAILAAAKESQVTPGIVVGQLENAGVLRHGKMSFLKRRYHWESDPYIPIVRG
ncbi:ImmA/IrrE family metallo-endopeptidase [Bradyrhizobium sp. CCBAU 45389]|uniref:ImmA/IrrE family metallo-endopeptidase n=1 Tax=Bradyrhizobium sp. CCBAU 45389 TaxID=858429 RepID=UPI00230520E9|nr:ImmA/IrrE family metallo-endopeptidase [Bradyrhizobium sp. CCBAU 45389]